MCMLPLDIANEEKIVRVIMTPSHVNQRKNTLKPAAFRPRAGTDEVSVIRHTHMGSDFCKLKGQSIAADNTKVRYVGLASLTADQIRNTKSTVHDSRNEYCGHAHIAHGIRSQPDEPQESATNMEITERCRALVSVATYHPDPNPSTPNWEGPTL